METKTTHTTYLKARQVAAILNVSLPQVYAKAKLRQWPSYRIQGMRGPRFLEEDIRKLLKKNTLDTELILDVSESENSGTPLSKDGVRKVKDRVRSIQEERRVVHRLLFGRPENPLISQN